MGSVYCSYCDLHQDGHISEDGVVACEFCGKTLYEDHLVSDIEYVKGPRGQSRMAGSFVRNVHSDFSASYEKTLQRGDDQIRWLISQLKINDTLQDNAARFFEMAAQKSFTRRHKIDYVAAACLYVACRVRNQPHLLIEFSEALEVNVYVIGAVFLHLCKFLSLEENPIIQKPVDPTLFIHKFTEGLVQKLEEHTVPKKEVIARISETASKLIASMKRDWMQTGRKPSGLCGAAIYISALSQGIRFSKSDIKTVVHICEATLTKRLIEFENTESGSLTIEEFNRRAEEIERVQSDGCSNKFGAGELICAHKGSEDHVAHGLCGTCYEEFLELSGGLSGGADPPSFQRSVNEEVALNNPVKSNYFSTYGQQESNFGRQGQKAVCQGNDNMVKNGVEELEEPEINCNDFGKSTAHEDLANDESDCLSDIDDKEVNCYLNNEEEVHYKKIIWEQINKEYLEEQALKRLANGEAYDDKEEVTDEVREARKHAAAAAAAVANARKEKRQKKAMDAKNAGPPQTAAEATNAMLTKKRLNSKVNYDVLEKLFADSEENPSKKSRTEEPTDATKDQEVGDDANNDYEDQEEDEIVTYDNDPAMNYGGDDESY